MLTQRVSNHSSEQAIFRLVWVSCVNLSAEAVCPHSAQGAALLCSPTSEIVWVFHVLLGGAVELLEKPERPVEVKNKRWDKCSG